MKIHKWRGEVGKNGPSTACAFGGRGSDVITLSRKWDAVTCPGCLSKRAHLSAKAIARAEARFAREIDADQKRELYGDDADFHRR